jgi:zinc protease
MSWTLETEARLGEGPPIKRFRADSGLGLILVVDRSAPIVCYQTWYRVGSRHEKPGATGMAHLFEHLMFNGTEQFPLGELDHLIERVGGETNAATWVDWTHYTTSVPAGELELAIRIESDRMQHLSLTDEILAAERDVVAAERMERVDDDVDGFLSEQLMALAFERHPYRWPTIGWMADIRAASRPDVEAFYRAYYAPNNATLVVVGDVDEDRVLDLLDRYYGAIPPSAIDDVPVPAEPAQTAPRVASFSRPVAADRILIGFRAPGQLDPDWPLLELADTLLTGSPSSRLYRRLVVDDELASAVDGSLLPFRDPALYELACSMNRGVPAERALAAVTDELERLAGEPVSDAELGKAKSCAETDFWTGLVGAEGTAEALGHYETALGDFRELLSIADRLASATAGELSAAVARHLVPAHRTSVVARPEEAA